MVAARLGLQACFYFSNRVTKNGVAFKHSPFFCSSCGCFRFARNAGDLVQKAELSAFHFTPHSCRHYFALQVYLQKRNLILVKELLGHRSLNATEVYLRLAAPTVFNDEGYINPLTLCEKVD